MSGAPGPGTRERVLSELRAATTSVTVAELAGRLQVHPNTVRFHLDTLVGQGQVEYVVGEPKGRGRPPVRVRAAAVLGGAQPHAYQGLAQALLAALRAGEDGGRRVGEAGQAWGASLVRSSPDAPPSVSPPSDDVLHSLLEEMGFAPERGGAPEGQIVLRQCPFVELAGTDQAVCTLHLGIIRGALRELGSDVEVTGLEPFAQPDRCIVHTRRGAAA